MKTLTEERYKIILQAVREKGIVKLNELVEITNTSESTIRRDLTYLESKNALKRVHGGASSIKRKFIEPSSKY